MRLFAFFLLSLFFLRSHQEVIDVTHSVNDFTLTFTLTNLENDWVKVDISHTLFEPDCSTCLEVHLEGEEIPYDGLFVHRKISANLLDEYKLLAPGQSVSTRVYIPDYFNIAKPGNYSIKVLSSFNHPPSLLNEGIAFVKSQLSKDGFSNIENVEELSKTQSLNMTLLSANMSQLEEIWDNITTAYTLETEPIIMSVNSFDRPTITNGQRTRLVISELAGNDNLTVNERDIVNQAKEAARIYMKNAIEQLSQGTANNSYGTWFENLQTYPKSPDYEFVLSSFKTMKKDMNDVNYLGFGKSCNSSKVAYRTRDTKDLFFCLNFFKDTYPLMGSDSRGSTVVHELAHILGGARDVSYKRNDCLEFAKSDPYYACRNARNYEFYVNSLPSLISLRGFSGFGLRVDENNVILSDQNVKSNLEFWCEGEFPKCELREKSSNKYLDYNLWTNRLRLGDDSPSFTLEYAGNGAYNLKFGWFDFKKGALKKNGEIRNFDGVNGRDETYRTYFEVSVNDSPSPTRWVEIQTEDHSRIGVGSLTNNALVTTEEAIPLKLEILGPYDNLIFRVIGTSPPLYLNRRLITDAVKIDDDVAEFGLELMKDYDDVRAKIWMENKGIPHGMGVRTFGWNKYQVYVDYYSSDVWSLVNIERKI